MRLPNPERAVIPVEKLRDYCLNDAHPVGKHKARVFRSVLGFGVQEAEQLAEMFQGVALTGEAVPGRADSYGQRYDIDVIIQEKQDVVLRSAWIVRRSEDFPRFLTCYLQVD